MCESIKIYFTDLPAEIVCISFTDGDERKVLATDETNREAIIAHVDYELAK